MMMFLEGDRGIGKSTLLRELLLPHAPLLAGFAVQRLFADGKQQGFRAVPLAEGYPLPCGEWCEGLAGVFIRNGRTDLRELAQVISTALAAARQADCRMILLDEIGGIELAAPAIMGALNEILALGKPCIGVLKSADNLRHIAEAAGLDVARTVGLRAALAQSLVQNGQVLTVRQETHDDACAAVQAFLARHLGEP